MVDLLAGLVLVSASIVIIAVASGLVWGWMKFSQFRRKHYR
jgi:hypothetical protein